MDVGDWLRQLGLESYEPIFRENRIDTDLLPKLTADDLKDLGVTLVGDRRRLLDAISALRERDSETELAAPPRSKLPLSATEAERRQLTVVFCDIVGSTSLSTRIDPEDLRSIIAAFERTVEETAARFAGFVAKYMGDGALIYFGYPRAQETDAERAVRAGLALVRLAGEIEAPDLTMRLRVGIATGLVVVGDLIGSGPAQERAVVGETPNLAARLQNLADPNTVLICPMTRRLVGQLFDCQDLDPVRLKGFAADISVTRVIGESALPGRFKALRAASLTPLVGRGEQLDLLLRRWERAQSGAGQVVLISGEPGLGKSRLAVALQDRLRNQPHIPLQYFCSPHHTDVALYPLLNQLEHATGIRPDDAPHAKFEKLRTLLARSAATDAEIGQFAGLFFVPTDDEQSTEAGSEHSKQRSLAAFMRQIEKLSANEPVLMIFEDAHWSDPTSIELLNLLVARIQELPILLVVTFRPEFQLQWTSEPHVTVLVLNRLDASETADFVQRVAGEEGLPATIVDQIVRRTDGVPLFIEELTRTVLESGRHDGENNQFQLDERPPWAIPATLQASLLARLDRLGSTREIAQIGAALGREFPHRLLLMVADSTEDELQIAMDLLIDAGLVLRHGLAPDATYLFKHALVQDAAYSTLLRSARRTLHTRIAAVLEQHFADIAQAQPELLARHHTEAKAPDKAAPYWLAAGRNNARRGAHIEAARLLDRALVAIGEFPEAASSRQLELEVHLALVPVLMAMGMASERTREIARRAIELCEKSGAMDRALPALFAEASYYSSSGEIETALELSSRVVGIGTDIDDPATLLAGHRFVGSCLLWIGDLEAAQRHLDMALSAADRIGHRKERGDTDFDHHAATLVLAGHLHLRRASFAEGWRLHDKAERLANDIGDAFTIAFVLLHRLLSEAMTSNLVSLRRTTQSFAELCERREIVQWRHIADLFTRWGAAKTESRSIAVPELMAIVDCHRQGTWQLQTPFFWKLAAEMLIAADEFNFARDLLDEASHLAEVSPQNWVKPELYRLYAVLAERGADPSSLTAEHWLKRSLGQAREQGEKYAELCAARDLGQLYARSGDSQRAREVLTAVSGDVAAVADELIMQEVDALLDKARYSVRQ
jgi:class 3 adenylate cyclase/tetratricopeptide (TPR) repeat protein